VSLSPWGARWRLELHQVDDVDHPHLQLGRCWRRMEVAAKTSRVGVSPQQAMTTSGSEPWSLLAQSQMPIPSVQCTTASSMLSHWGSACFPPHDVDVVRLRRQWSTTDSRQLASAEVDPHDVRLLIDHMVKKPGSWWVKPLWSCCHTCEESR